MVVIDTEQPFYKKSPSELIESFKRFPPKQRQRIVIVAVALVLFVPLVFWPAWILRPLQDFQKKSLKMQILNARSQIAKEPQLIEEKRGYEAWIAEAELKHFSKADLQGMLGLLSSLAQKSRVVILSSQPQSETQTIPKPFDEAYEVYSYLLSLEGGYHDLATFVSEVESHTKVLKVDEFSLMPAEDNQEIQSGEMRISVFLKRDTKR